MSVEKDPIPQGVRTTAENLKQTLTHSDFFLEYFPETVIEDHRAWGLGHVIIRGIGYSDEEEKIYLSCAYDPGVMEEIMSVDLENPSKVLDLPVNDNGRLKEGWEKFEDRDLKFQIYYKKGSTEEKH